MPTITLANQPRVLVQLLPPISGGDDWQSKPQWFVESFTTAVRGAGEALFRTPNVTGGVSLRNVRTQADEDPDPELVFADQLIGRVVRICSTDASDLPVSYGGVEYGPIWYGIITSVEFASDGPVAESPSGWWNIRAVEFGVLLAQRPVRFCWLHAGPMPPTDPGGDPPDPIVRLCRAPLVFNALQGGDQYIELVATPWDADSPIPVFEYRHDRPDLRKPWTLKAALEHLLFTNGWGPNPAFDSGALYGLRPLVDAPAAADTLVIDRFDPTGLSLAEAITRLCEQFAMTWSVEVDYTASEPYLKVWVFSALTQPLSVTSQTSDPPVTVTLPAGTTLEVPAEPIAAEVVYSGERLVDSIVVRGRRATLMALQWSRRTDKNYSNPNGAGYINPFSVPFYQLTSPSASLEPDWSADEEAACEAFYKATTPSTMRPPHLGAAWRRFRVRFGWSGTLSVQSGNPPDPTAGIPDTPEFETNETFGQDGLTGRATRVGGAYPEPWAALRLVDQMPVSCRTQVGPGGQIQLVLAPGDERTSPVMVGAPMGADGQSRFAVYITNDPYPAIEVDDFAGGRTLWSQMRLGAPLTVIVGVEPNIPFEVSWVRPDAERPRDDISTVVFDLPDCWYITAPKRLVLFGVLAPTADVVLRDDTPRMMSFLAAAKAIRSAPAGKWRLSFAGLHGASTETPIGGLWPGKIPADGLLETSLRGFVVKNAPITCVERRVVGKTWRTVVRGETVAPELRALFSVEHRA